MSGFAAFFSGFSGNKTSHVIRAVIESFFSFSWLGKTYARLPTTATPKVSSTFASIWAASIPALRYMASGLA